MLNQLSPKSPPIIRYFALVVVIIALLMFATYLPIIGLRNDEASFANSLNMAGRQRMLSQRIPLLAEMIAHSETDGRMAEYTVEMAELITLMRLNHERLVAMADSAELQALYFREPYHVNARVTSFLNAAEEVLRLINAETYSDNTAMILAIGAQPLVDSLDRVVEEMQRIHEASISNLEQFELVMLVLMLAALGIIALLVFGPLQRRIRLAETTLNTQTAFVTRMLSTVPNIVYILNLKNQSVTYSNEFLGSILGLTSEKVRQMGASISAMVIHPDDFAAYGLFLGDISHAKDGDILTLEARARDASGSYRKFRNYGTVFRRDEQGAVVETLHIAADITDVQAADQRERDAAMQAERVRMLHGFLSDTSHELRTPLTIINNSSYLLNRIEDPAERKKHSTIITDQVKRINSLIDQMQEMIRLTTVTQLEHAPVSINTLIQQVIEGMKSIPEKAILLECRLDADLPLIEGDAARLQKAIYCVLDNAVRFTPAEGSVSITSAMVIHGGRAMVSVDIRDSGPGIPTEDMPRVFDQFFKGNRARTPDGSGAGLGLTMARQIMVLHDGSISVRANEGGGAHFTLLLPV
ncbi:MAG: PAS domain-containing protein [Pleurocapsa minor GSE-CHR-MK-17-07R]|jgi:signal transduction histidine kinase|nr:PAS domain-containing protein [Pleurocapsa minor GSE-CHR-MK 17-07R]